MLRQRRFPYPYKALLAIAADVDSTSPWKFLRIHRFFNTLTPAIPHYGDGVGLDIGNSFFSKTYRIMRSVFTIPRIDITVKMYGRMNSVAR